MVTRNYDDELDTLTNQMNEVKQLVNQLINEKATQAYRGQATGVVIQHDSKPSAETDLGAIFYSGQYKGKNSFRWEPQQRNVSQLLAIDGDKISKVLAALGNKQRLEILMAVMHEPLTGTEIVEQLNMGTTGQLYHHTKALLGADLLVQEDRGGKYSLPAHRSLPLLLLLAAGSDLIDTSDYMELTETRNQAGDYLGDNSKEYDPHQLIWAVIENTILEHQSGYCNEVNLILQTDGSITVADNGRGIPTHAISQTNKTNVQAVLTEINRHHATAAVLAPEGVKGINIPVVNALSQRLSIEIRREGKVFHQAYKHGIPQTELLVIGTTRETGTSLTFKPDTELFHSAAFNKDIIKHHLEELSSSYPELKINLL